MKIRMYFTFSSLSIMKCTASVYSISEFVDDLVNAVERAIISIAR